MALVSGQDRIADVILSLSKVFRYNLSEADHGKNHEAVGEELAHLSHVFALYRLRYGDGLRLNMQIDPAVVSCRIIRFVFQPIIENVLKHGLVNNRQTLDITITGSRSDDRIVFHVTDNGSGMAPAKLAEVQAALAAHDGSPETEAGGIGLRNVHQRIRLSCGDAYGLTIRSRQGEGTTVTITLPAAE
jgi:two-component system sensor histidine kinase YesM